MHAKKCWTCGTQAIIPTYWTKSARFCPYGTTPCSLTPRIWTALDRLAARAGLSASGLAKKAGLDPTTFNKSKRITPEGRPRWPSTESVAKSLAATGTTMDTFVQLIGDVGRSAPRSVPLIGLAQAGSGGYFDDAGFPVGKGWDEIPFPAVNDENAYALEISGNSMEPAYRDGTVIIVSPRASIRRGDRVAVKTRDGEVMVKELSGAPRRSIELRSVNPEHDRAHAARCATCCGCPASSGRASDTGRLGQIVPEHPAGADEIDSADGEDDRPRPLAKSVVGHALEHEGRKRSAGDRQQDRRHRWPRAAGRRRPRASRNRARARCG